MTMIRNKLELEPRFYEVDSYNIVNNMYYVSWCEMARLRVAKDAGLLVPKLFDEKIMFVVEKINVQYQNATSLWDRIQVNTLVRLTAATRLDFHHSIKSKITNQQMAQATSSIVCLKEGRLMTQLPDWFEGKLHKYIDEVQKGMDEWPVF